jgi:hypothetical protein
MREDRIGRTGTDPTSRTPAFQGFWIAMRALDLSSPVLISFKRNIRKEI